jgi:hypothetical protein
MRAEAGALAAGLVVQLDTYVSTDYPEEQVAALHEAAANLVAPARRLIGQASPLHGPSALHL